MMLCHVFSRGTQGAKAVRNLQTYLGQGGFKRDFSGKKTAMIKPDSEGLDEVMPRENHDFQEHFEDR